MRSFLSRAFTTALDAAYLMSPSSKAARSLTRTARWHARSPIPVRPLSDFNGISDTLRLPALGENVDRQQIALATFATEARRIFEFGTKFGISALIFAMNGAHEVYTVDLPDDAAPEIAPHPVDATHIRSSRGRVGELFTNRPEFSRIRQLRCDSRHLDISAFKGDFDLVYVDGGHSYDVIASDTKLAFELISNSGRIVWDDYFWLYPDVVRFLDGLLSECLLTRIAGTHLVTFNHHHQA